MFVHAVSMNLFIYTLSAQISAAATPQGWEHEIQYVYLCACVFKVEPDKKKEGRNIGKKSDEHFFV